MFPAATPRNKLLCQTFEWHTSSLPPEPHETHSTTSHYARLTRLVPYLADLSITSLWLPPGCKANNPHGNGYDCYDLWDLGEFDQKWSRSTKWGSREELDALIDVAHSHKVEIIWDAVLNHKTAGDSTVECWAVECESRDRRIEICSPKQIQAWLKYEFPGRKEQYSSFKWSAEHFNGTDWDQHREENAIYKLIDPPSQERHANSRKEKVNKTSEAFRWLKQWYPGRLPRRNGKGWSMDVDDENGNNDYLMFSNIDYTHQDVVKDVQQWGEWMMRDVHVGGFRLDAAQHISFSFTREWIRKMKDVSKEVLVIGEIWTGDVRRILKWLGAVGQDVMAFDSPLLYNFSKMSVAIKNRENVDLRRILNGSLLQGTPRSAVTLVTNHDTQPGQTSYVPMLAEHKLLFYAYILLRRDGLPCVFWGDLFGTAGPQSESAIGLLGTRSVLCDLILLRSHVAYGEQQDYFDDPHCIAWRRHGTHDRPGCLVMINVSGDVKHKSVQMDQPHERWVSVLRQDVENETVTTDASATGRFSCDNLKVAVYVKQQDAKDINLPFPFSSMQDRFNE